MKRVLIFLIILILTFSCGTKRVIYNNKSIEPKKEVKSSTKTPKGKKFKKVDTAPKILNTEDYVKYYSNIAMDEMIQFGIPASITLAQGILESGAGKGRLAVQANNHFGIKCHDWVDEVIDDTEKLVERVKNAQKNKEIVSIAYHGNIVDVWESFYKNNITVDIGSDQTSLHNPWSGGYYPVGYSFEEANKLIYENPKKFKSEVKLSLKRHVDIVNKHVKRGTYFFDYGNAFLLEASKAEADILKKDGSFKYPSYVQDIMGPMCFDYGFGPFRWVCSSCKQEDLDITDAIACEVLEKLALNAPEDTKQQMMDNIQWIKAAKENELVF